MDGERISLRLEGEDLELIDAFVRKHPEFANRSHLARIALRAFVEQASGKASAAPNQITIVLPPMILAQLHSAVEGGTYSGLNAVIEETLRNAWVPSETREERKKVSYERNEKLYQRM